MDWPTRREQLRWYLRDHKWWWKWPIVIAIVAVWGAAFALFLRPWQPSPASIDDTATPPPTTEVSDYDFSDELPAGLDASSPEDDDDADTPDAEEESATARVTSTLDELAASLLGGDGTTDAPVADSTENEAAETETRSSRRPPRSESADAEPEPAPVLPAPIATPPPTTRPRPTTTTTVRPSVNTPLPTFSTRPPSSPTTTVRPVTTTTQPPPTTPPPTTAPPTTAPPPPPTVTTTLPPPPPLPPPVPPTPPLELVD